MRPMQIFLMEQYYQVLDFIISIKFENKMKYPIIFFLVFLTSCASKPSNEFEEMGEQVLKRGQGLEFDIRPLPKEK